MIRHRRPLDARRGVRSAAAVAVPVAPVKALAVAPVGALFAALIVALAVFAPARAWAGIGSAESGPTIIDTVPPVIAVADPAPGTWLQTGEQITLAYSYFDDNPGPDAGDTRLEIWYGEAVHELGPDIVLPGDFLWTWAAPDTSTNVSLALRATDLMGNTAWVRSAGFRVFGSASDVPSSMHGPVFAPPAPNPFNPTTTLRFDLPVAGRVRVAVHDVRGRLVRVLAAGGRPAGAFSLTWDGRDGSGRPQPAGSYFFRLEYPGPRGPAVAVRRATLLP